MLVVTVAQWQKKAEAVLRKKGWQEVAAYSLEPDHKVTMFVKVLRPVALKKKPRKPTETCNRGCCDLEQITET